MRRNQRPHRLRGRAFSLAQRLGRSLMLPIAGLPIAAIFVRFGQSDMLGQNGLGASVTALVPVARVLAAAGNAVMENIPLLFAVGVAIGFARKADGTTALAAIIGYFTFAGVERSLSPLILGKPGPLTNEQVTCLRNASKYISIDYEAKDSLGLCGIHGQELITYGVFGGIVVGLLTAYLWARFYKTKLPAALAFFSGRRFVPILATTACLLLGVAMAVIYPLFKAIFTDGLGALMTESNNSVLAAGIFGLVQRLLLPFGLHHIANTVPYFTLGTCTSPTGEILHGDFSCFFAGQAGSFRPEGYVPGTYMAGQFPIMMGGLPGAALAMYRCARSGQRKRVGALMASGAIASFLTGITEPIEFAFAYAAVPLYFIHALLVSSSMMICAGLGIRGGYSFSAGGVDYLLNFTRSAQLSTSGATGTLLMLVLAAIYFVIYYLLFTGAIKYFNIATPGRPTKRSERAGAQAYM